MYTQCPECQTVFEVTPDLLKKAKGNVRCSHCQAIFNAKQHELNDLPISANNDAHSEDLTLEGLQVDEPLTADFVEPPPKRSLASLLLWSLFAIILMGGLTAQYFWFMQPEIVLQNEYIRPALTLTCDIASCELPVTRNVKLIHMDKHIVQTHSTLANTLQFDATFTNTAFFPQPYPDLLLTFHDYKENPIAQRRFIPKEYLNRLLDKQLMKAGETVHLRLELIEMQNVVEGQNIMQGYKFEFL